MSHSLMGKFQREAKSNRIRWDENLKLYRASKQLTKLIDKYSLKKLSELMGYSISYISGVEGFHIKPNKEFINKLEQLNETIWTTMPGYYKSIFYRGN